MSCFEAHRDPLRHVASKLSATLAILLFLTLIVAVGCSKGDGSTEKYRLSAADRGAVKVVVMATGTLAAVTTVQVGSQVSGTIEQILVDFNSTVKKGQVIARLDPTFLEAAVREAEANLVRSQATFAQAERELVRAKDLFDKHLAAQVDHDNAITAVDVAKAGVEQSKGALERARINLAYSVILSPIDGIVISRAIDVGQTVAASLQAPTLFTIAQDLKQMQVETNIDEADIGGLREGMEVSFTVDGYPEEKFRGSIRQIRYAATVNQNVVTYPVIINVSNAELKLRPGMTANVSIVIAERDDALRVPATALRFKPTAAKAGAASAKSNQNSSNATAAEGRERGSARDGKSKKESGDSTRKTSNTSSDSNQVRASGNNEEKTGTIYVRSASGEPEPRKVRIGLNDGSYVEILGGEIADGDSVIVGRAGTSASTSSGGVPGLTPGVGRPR